MNPIGEIIGAWQGERVLRFFKWLALVAVLLYFGIAAYGRHHAKKLPPYTLQLSKTQAELVETCWGNGWDARVQSDGEGGMQIACKAAH